MAPTTTTTGPAKRPPGRPRTLPIGEQRRLILEAARRIFAEHDFHGSTIDAVAREAGVARALVYELFGNKRELFIAVVDEAVEAMIEQFAEDEEKRRAMAQLPIRPRIRARVAALFEFIHTHGDTAAIIRIAEYGGVGPAKSDIIAGRQRIEDGLALIYQEAWADIAPISLDAARVLSLSTLSLVEAVGFRQPHEPGWEAEATIDLVTEILRGALMHLGTSCEDLMTGFGTVNPQA